LNPGCVFKGGFSYFQHSVISLTAAVAKHHLSKKAMLIKLYDHV
jgi:hypothetical protein